MITRECKHCKKILSFEKIQQFSHHVSRCLCNPSLSTTLARVREVTQARFIRKVYALKCSRCYKVFSLTLTPRQYETGRHNKCCSKECWHQSRTTGQCYNCQQNFLYHKHNRRGKFCSIECRSQYRSNVTSLQRFEKGLIKERATLRKILARLNGYQCSNCKIAEWNGKPLTLQVDHVDGDPGNNKPGNLRLICPNCHSQTKTWGGRNKGSGRKMRGLSLA